MQKYAMAGVQAMPGTRMNVRSHVRVPDGEAGAGGERQPYCAAGEQPLVNRRAATIPANIGVLFLCVVFVLFGGLALKRAVKRAELSKQISQMESGIAQSLRDTTQLTVDVMAARDSARICYAAAQNLGMVAATGVDAVTVVAPDTRPSMAQQNSSAGGSPLSAGQGTISGSR